MIISKEREKRGKKIGAKFYFMEQIELFRKN